MSDLVASFIELPGTLDLELRPRSSSGRGRCRHWLSLLLPRLLESPPPLLIGDSGELMSAMQ